MPLALLLPELREAILDTLTAKQLVALRATCHQFRAAARAALHKPRFKERKEAAALGARLLESVEEEWFLWGELPPGEGTSLRALAAQVRVRELLTQNMRMHWNDEREVAVGVYAAGSAHNNVAVDGYVRAVHADGTCDLEPYDDDEEEVDDYTNVRVESVWSAPSSMRSGILAIQDWDPRVFAYFMHLLTDPMADGLVLRQNMLLTDIVETTIDLGNGTWRRCEEPPPLTLFAAICEWDSDVSFDGLGLWFAQTHRGLVKLIETHGGFGVTAADHIHEAVLDAIRSMPAKPAARVFNLVYRESAWTNGGQLLGSLAEKVLPHNEDDDLDYILEFEHYGEVLRLCLTTDSDVMALIDALWNHSCHAPFDVMERCGFFLQVVCNRDQALQVVTINCLNSNLRSHLPPDEMAGYYPRATVVKMVGYYLKGLFDYDCTADDSPPPVLMDWLETSGEVTTYATILRECFDEEGLKGLVGHLDRWKDESMERAAELVVAWHPEGGGQQVIWDLQDVLQPPWWPSTRRAKARRQRLLDAVSALGIGRS